jgi:transcriptional antiterminator RfaH
MSDEARWYLIHCKPQQDTRALAHLERQGYQCYAPTINTEKLRGRRKAIIQEPLFPRYLFIHLNEIEDNWYPIRSTRGVGNIVSSNGQPIPVHDRVIDDIRTRVAHRTDLARRTDVAHRIHCEPYLTPGQPVEITDGPFAQLEGIFLADDGDERVVLLLNILQHAQRLSFPIQSVRKLLKSNVA